MIQIYHNSRCRKSREGLEFLKSITTDFKTIEYLNNPPNEDNLKDILAKLNMKAMDIVRTNEDIWKSNYKGRDLSEDEIIQAMAANPKLIQRPIIIKGEKAILARPVEKIMELF